MPGTRNLHRWGFVAAAVAAITGAAWLAGRSSGVAESPAQSAVERDAVLVQLNERDQLRERMRRALNDAAEHAASPWPEFEPPPPSLLAPDAALSASLRDLRRAIDGPGLVRPTAPDPLRLLNQLGAPTMNGSLLGTPRNDRLLLPQPDSPALLSETIAPQRPREVDPLTLVDH